jgi:hypothetical protein
VVFVAVLCSVIFANSEDVESNFKLLDDQRSLFEISNFHLNFIGFVINIPAPIFPLRMHDLKAPGDYFRHPRGAESIELTKADINEVENSLMNTIGFQYYDSYILDNLTGYEYSLLGGKILRREYYVKYARGDTIYVISGLLGEFLSFYRAISDETRLSVEQVKNEASGLSPAVRFEKNDSFVAKENEYIYFLEHLDRESKLRVRNYQVVEYWQQSDKNRDDSIGKYYNLIEITRFLDEEAMP